MMEDSQSSRIPGPPLCPLWNPSISHCEADEHAGLSSSASPGASWGSGDGWGGLIRPQVVQHADLFELRTMDS